MPESKSTITVIFMLACCIQLQCSSSAEQRSQEQSSESVTSSDESYEDADIHSDPQNSDGATPNEEPLSEEPEPGQNYVSSDFHYLLPPPGNNQSTLRSILANDDADLRDLEQLARSLEQESRSRIGEQYQLMREQVCSVADITEQQTYVQKELRAARFQWQNWQTLNLNMERWLSHQLETLLSEWELERIERSLALINEMRFFRQQSVYRFWQRNLKLLEEDGCDEDSEAIALEERLFLPYYVALYRFANELPPAARRRIFRSN